jgi:hypothetical protein
MTRRKGAITRRDLQRNWSHHVVLALRRTTAPSAALLTYSLRRDDSDFVMFCFSELEDAEVIAESCGGKRLCSVGDNSENKRGDRRPSLDRG